MEGEMRGRRRIAFVFPGQGSQYVGMGKDVYESSPAAQEVFHEAEETLGVKLRRLCFEGPQEVLQDTVNAQPAILTVSLACLGALRERWEAMGKSISPQLVAGHSLGEYSALVAAGALSLRDAVLLVRERGRLMKESGEETPGGMAAVVGLDDAALEEVCRKARSRGIVCPANYNSPGQTVISGEMVALTEAMQLAIAEGSRKVVRLAVSIAAHSPLMRRAADQFAEALSRFRFNEACIPVVANITAQAITSVEDIKRELAEQICHSVQWTRTVRQMLDAGVTTFVEIGPGQVLSGLVKRADKNVEALSIGSLPSLEAFTARLALDQ